MFVLVSGMAGSIMAKPLVLNPSKDGFFRSNQQIHNNGGSTELYVAQAPSFRVIMAFDLSTVTNQILGAKLRFLQANTKENPISLVIAPMVQTTNNAAWGEGTGNLGAVGQNARPGSACYLRSAYPKVSWESSDGSAVPDIGAPALWKSPIASLNNLQWTTGKWVEVPIKPVSLLENIRTSTTKTITLGLWGTSGNGLYAIASKESENAPELILKVKEAKGKGK